MGTDRPLRAALGLAQRPTLNGAVVGIGARCLDYTCASEAAARDNGLSADATMEGHVSIHIAQAVAPRTPAVRFPGICRLAHRLGRPVVILDLETTGLPGCAPVGVVEIATLTIEPTGRATSWSSLVNPGFPIPADAVAVHGITDEDVRTAPGLSAHLDRLKVMFAHCAISGFNSIEYDVPVLLAAAEREAVSSGVSLAAPQRQLDVRYAWSHLCSGQRRSLAAAAAAFGVRPGTAHRAAGDVETTADVLEAMIERYGPAFIADAATTKPVGPSPNARALSA